MKNILLTLMLGIFLISLVSADLGIYKQNEDISVRGNLNATSVNVTIYFPNSSIAVNNQSMINIYGDIWNYPFTNTDTQGRYIYDYCNENGDNCKENFFTVTPNGQVFSTGKAISYLGFIVILLFTFFLTVYGAMKVRWKHQKSDEEKILTINHFRYVKVLLFTIAYFELMFLFGLSYKFFAEASIEGFTEFFNFIYQLFLSLIFPLMIFLIIFVFVIWINNKKLSKRLSLGLDK